MTVGLYVPEAPQLWLPGRNTRGPRERMAEDARRHFLERFGLVPIGGGAANAWDFYNSFTEFVADGTMDLDGDSFKIALFLSSSNCATLTHDAYGDLTNEHSNANGYTTGGQALTSVTWSRSGGTTTFDSANAQWTASGGSITARFAVIYDDTVSSPADALVCYSLLDNAPADVTATAGNTFTITMHSSGIMTLAT